MYICIHVCMYVYMYIHVCVYYFVYISWTNMLLDCVFTILLKLFKPHSEQSELLLLQHNDNDHTNSDNNNNTFE